MKRVLTVALIAALSFGISRPAFADQREQSIKQSIADIESSALATADQASPNAPNKSSDNPYFWPAVALLGGGGVVALYGMTHDTGVTCTDTRSATSCGVTKSKATIFVGVGMIGAGAWLFYKGKNHPDVVFGPRMVGVRQQFVW